MRALLVGTVCCRRRSQCVSIDLQEPLPPLPAPAGPHASGFPNNPGIVTYDGLENCIINSRSYDDDSGLTGGSGFVSTASVDEDASTCTSKEVYGSSPSECLQLSNYNDSAVCHLENVRCLVVKGKAPVTYMMSALEVDAMKEQFARLLLGNDISGGARGTSTALALSNAITTLSATIFGEMWKLEPLSDDKKNRWHRQMDWLLSPTAYMVELVPAKQCSSDGTLLEIMTPKARAEVQMNLPALQKLDTLLIEVLDSMVDMEFWYEEHGSRADDGQKKFKKWWLPFPHLPELGLSDHQRKRLVFQAKVVHQVLKAAKNINEQVLFQMPIPTAVKAALPQSGKASLGEELHHAITADVISIDQVICSLNITNENSVLETVNRLEGAAFAWKQRMTEEAFKKLPARYPWNLRRSYASQLSKVKRYVERVELVLQLLRAKYPNLPHSFIEVVKVQYNMDVAYSILEAYSRVLVGVAFSILSRIADILVEDDLIKKGSNPDAVLKFDLKSDVFLAGITETPPGHIRRSLMEQINTIDNRVEVCEQTRKRGVKQLAW